MADNDNQDVRPPESSNEEKRDPSGDSLDIRHEREVHLQRDAASTPRASRDLPAVNVGQNRENGAADPERQQIIQQTVNAVLQEIHLHVPVKENDLEILSRMRAELPEFYEQHIKNMRAVRELEEFETHSRYEVPAKYAKRGQILGLIATVLTLGVVILAIVHDSPWVAAVLGTVDLVAIAAVFGSNQKPNER